MRFAFVVCSKHKRKLFADPTVRGSSSVNLNNAVVIVDEAHNIGLLLENVFAPFYLNVVYHN